MQLWWWLLAVVATLSGCDGCGTRENNPEKLDLKLNWSLYGEHAAFFVAEAKGYYRDEGLEVRILPGNGSGSTTKLVAEGLFKIGYADSATMAKFFADGYATKSVAVFTQTSPMSLVTLAETPIRTWQDIRGKKIGITISDAASALFKVVLGKLQLQESDVEILKIATPHARGKALMEKRIDGFFGYYINEPPRLEYQYGTELSWLPIVDLDIRFLSSSIIVNPQFLATHGETVRKFVRASQKGLRYTVRHPVEAAKILADNTADFDTATALEMIRRHIEIIDTPSSAEHPLGWSSEQDWLRTISFLENYYSFPSVIEPGEFYTNELLSNVKK